MDDFDASIPFARYKKIATPVRIVLAGIIGVQFFGIFQIPQEVLYPAAVLSIMHLISIGFEKSRLSTVEIAERKCPKCEKPMFSKLIKCEKCGIQLDTEEEK